MTPAQRRPAHPAPRRRVAAAAGALLVPAALVAAGVLAYAFLSLAARALGPDRYGPVALLWAATFLTAVVLFRAVEQTGSREIAARLERGEDIRPVARALARVVAALVGLVVVTSAALWQPITNSMFDGKPEFTAAFIVGVALYGVFDLMRGLTAGIGWFGGYAGTLLADGVASPRHRGAAASFSASAGWAMVAIVAAPAAGARVAAATGSAGAGAPSPAGERGAVQRRRRAALRRAGRRDRRRRIRRSSTAAPLLVAVGGVGDTRAAGVVFAATMLVRAPVFVFQGVGAVLLPRLAAVHAAGDRDGSARRSSVWRPSSASACSLLVPVAYVAGRWAMGAFDGAGFTATGADLAILTGGVACYLVAATVAQGRSRAATQVWAASPGVSQPRPSLDSRWRSAAARSIASAWRSSWARASLRSSRRSRCARSSRSLRVASAPRPLVGASRNV